ncbi:MAG: hypothetical protein VB048_07070 [Bacteroidaceae bacterium]|nr:hypothetical protein [Bacteroidaceae bacterium]
MIIKRLILCSDSVNKYGYSFAVSSLAKALSEKALYGVPTCLGHDIHRIAGWTLPIGLYMKPGLNLALGKCLIPESDEEQKQLCILHSKELSYRNKKLCEQDIVEFKKIISDKITEKAENIYSSAVCIYDIGIINRVFPNLYKNIDEDGLINISQLFKDFVYIGGGIFKNKSSEILVFVHRYFRKSLSIFNSINHFFIDELIKEADNINIKIALDFDLIGYAKTYSQTIELEYWYGPKFNDDVSKIPSGVTVHSADEYSKYLDGIDKTEFFWKKESDMQTLEIEEIRNIPSFWVEKDSWGCRYIHSIYDDLAKSFIHFDGAIRMYTTDEMIHRISKDIRTAGKHTFYTKIFRVDGKMNIEKWKNLVCHYYQSNLLVPEYFGSLKENIRQRHSVEQEKDLVETLVPYSMKKEDGIRLFVSYHHKSEDIKKNKYERYITDCDSILYGDKNLDIIESNIFEILKAFRRKKCEIHLPSDISFIVNNDLYWNIPTIHHSNNENIEKNIAETLAILKLVFEFKEKKSPNSVISFSISWNCHDKKIKLAIIGNVSNILKWLNYNIEIPLDSNLFYSWLEKQKSFLNSNFNKNSDIDKPSINEIMCSDGSLYIKRRSLPNNIKYRRYFDDDNNVKYEFKCSTSQIDFYNAITKKEIEISDAFICEKFICSKCNKDYRLCNHSKLLDDNVTVMLKDLKFINGFLTDRKA